MKLMELIVAIFPFRLFEEHQDLLDLFSKFKELKTKEAQANSMELAEHATKVMNTLDEGIKQLDNIDSFFQYLTNVGASHRKIPGFKPEYFWVSFMNYSFESKSPINSYMGGAFNFPPKKHYFSKVYLLRKSIKNFFYNFLHETYQFW